MNRFRTLSQRTLQALALLLFAVSAPICHAQVTLDRQLLVNPGAEDGAASPTGQAAVAIPGWNTFGTAFTVDTYASDYNVPAREGQRVGGGANFFFGGVKNSFSYCRQFINVAPLAGEIDGGAVKVAFSAFMTGWRQEDDYGVIELKFYNAAGAIFGPTLKLGPQPGNFSEWVYHRTTGAVPAGTRKIEVQMISFRLLGNDNDSSFDDLSVVLTKSLPYAPSPIPEPSRTFRSDNLVNNGGAESGSSSASGNEVVAVPGWATTGNFTVANYGGPNTPTAAAGNAVSGGKAVFSGGPGTNPSSLRQVINITAYAADIDAGKYDFRFSFASGAAGTRDTTAQAVLELLDASNRVALTFEPSPVVATSSGMANYTWESPLPPGVRRVRITLHSRPEQGGTAYNGGFFDNLSLRLIDTIPIPLAGSSFVTPANPTYGNNLLVDPGAEGATPIFDNYGVVVPIPGWSTTGNFSAVHAYQPDYLISGAMERIGGGKAFFAGGVSPLSTASQTVDVSHFSQAIDEGKIFAHLEGQIGGFAGQGDHGRALAYFLDYTSTPIGPPIFIGPSSHGTPSGGDFQFYQNDGKVPAGTRQVQVVLAAQRLTPAYADAYFDNLWLSLNSMAEPQVLRGDVDGSGIVDVADAILLLRHCLKLITLDAAQTVRADMNRDGSAAITDAPLILRRLVGLPWEV